jgi:SAM-dependent methyltransferase
MGRTTNEDEMTRKDEIASEDERNDRDSPSAADSAAFRAAVRDGYDDLAAEYDAVRDDSDPPTVLVDALAAVPEGARLLDVGCGGGRGVLGAFAARFDAVGLDVSREQLRLAGERAPTARFVQGDMTALPLRDDSVDALTALHSVIHVPSDQHVDVYREFRRVLRDGGEAVVSAGTAAFEAENEDWLDSGTAMRWSIPDPETTEAALADAGFEVVEYEVVSGVTGGDWRYYRLA